MLANDVVYGAFVISQAVRAALSCYLNVKISQSHTEAKKKFYMIFNLDDDVAPLGLDKDQRRQHKYEEYASA